MPNATSRLERQAEDLRERDSMETAGEETEAFAIHPMGGALGPRQRFSITSLQHWIDLCA